MRWDLIKILFTKSHCELQLTFLFMACSHTVPLWITAGVVKISLPWDTYQCPYKREHSWCYLLGFSEGLLTLRWTLKLGYACREHKTVLYSVPKQGRLYEELFLGSLRTTDTSVKYAAKRRQELGYPYVPSACPAFAFTNTNFPFCSRDKKHPCRMPPRGIPVQ